ncbi:CD109 antigen-like [Parambassis ranga]|uniref:CD109 antigen-like n=1 Tax=Parambassis ranga TaxID=210632 RepID=A0A6P7H871_9TELE|nr:CD109 antigen-like [Parambassis ranga]
MNGIWTLAVCLEVVCLAAFGSTQQSSSALFLISGPEEVHAGTSTPLAVTVFADFPGRVRAEMAQGNTRVSQTEDIQGGLTRVLTLPPIPGSITHNSLLNLTVWCYRGDSLIFTNTTTLLFNLRNVSSFIQTDRSRYQPGDAVQVRIVFVQLDNRPYRGMVEMSVQDPAGRVVERWKSTGNQGIVLRDFTLAHNASFGQWAITTTVNGVTNGKAFIVDHNEHHSFELLVNTPSQVLVGGDISGSVRALYYTGQPVHGTLAVSVSMNDTASPSLLTQPKEIYGSTQFFFSNNQLQALQTSLVTSSNGNAVVHVAACVTDNSTGLKVNKTIEVHLMRNTFQLTFLNFPETLKPSLHFSAKLRISRYDGKPLSTEDLMHSAVVKVTQRTAVMTAEPTTLTLPVPEDGNVHIKFKLQERVVMLLVSATFQSSEETLKLYTNDSSPSGSYIQISPVNTSPAKVSIPLQLSVESTFQLPKLHFVVTSKGQVLAAGTKNSSSFSLTPELSWFPEACITVYSMLSDGEVPTDTLHILIYPYNNVNLTWSSDKAHPGEQVSLTVTLGETMSQVGIMVMGTHDDATHADVDVKLEEECNQWMLTNARLFKMKQHRGPKSDRDVPVVQKYWSQWTDDTESLLWLDATVSDMVWTSGKITVPDGVTSLRALALVMSENQGLGFTPVPQKLIVTKDFSLSMDVPPHLIRGEEIVLEVNIINHLEKDIDIIVLLAQSEAFEFVLTDRKGVSVVNAQKLTLGSHVSASALFAIRPLVLGEMDISVDAVSEEASESLSRRVNVKPEGVEQTISQTLFLELEPGKYNNSRTISFAFPPDVVPGSQRAHMALVGDILALSIKYLDSLIQMPVGCGEQNMIHFAPNVYVLKYLNSSNQDDKEVRRRAMGYMMEGYQRQLSYQQDNGSFSAFGNSDPSGSTWLTAFVLRCFFEAQLYMQVDQSVLTKAMTWLLKQQGSQGEFTERGQLIHTEMQGGLDDGPVALTAYVLMALVEAEKDVDSYSESVSKAKTYLENKFSSGVVSNYSLCLVAYALSLVNSPVAGNVLRELSRRAHIKDGVMMWTSSAGMGSDAHQVRSAQIEMTSYVLLALFRRGSFNEAIALMKWLSMQRNHLGGYGTTQDTVVALQALAKYAAFSGAVAIDLRFNISAPKFVSLFQINSTNYRAYQSQEINADKDLHLNIYMEGRGFATFQLNVFYNLDSKAFSQHLQQATSEEAFTLHVEVSGDRDHDHMMLEICTRLKDSQVIPRTGMALLDVGMLSGFTLSPGAAVPTGLIKKVEMTPEKVSLYLDSLNKTEVCIRLPFIRHYKVAHLHSAVVHVYDYYEPTRKAISTYKSDVLSGVGACFYCGSNCDRCRPGITITVPSPLVSHSIRSASYSLCCLLAGMIAFLTIG